MAGRVVSAMQSSSAINFAKLLLTIFNIVFLISGLAILVLGVWMHVELYRFIQLTTVYYDAAPYILIGIGSSILLVGCFGCMCTVKGHGSLLYLFSALLLVVFLVELGTAISTFVYKAHIEEGFSEGLSLAMEHYHDDMNKHYALDGIQIRFKCCGKYSYADWMNSNVTNQLQSKVPISCCIVVSCDPTNSRQIHQEGCMQKLSSFMGSNFSVVGGVAVAFGLLQLMGAMLSWCLGKNINKAKYEQVE